MQLYNASSHLYMFDRRYTGFTAAVALGSSTSASLKKTSDSMKAQKKTVMDVLTTMMLTMMGCIMMTSCCVCGSK